MFGSRSRRHRALNPQPLTAATANPEAATAAAAVFRRHESNSSLSASAAAAALRARPTTPTRVAEVQTKRTMRRSASVASTPTAPERAHAPPPGLRRHSSSGSMAERTFRTPSPNRPASSASGQQRGQYLNEDPPPPVPALPRDIDAVTSGQAGRFTNSNNNNNNNNNNSSSSSSSIRMSGTPVRLASQKLASGDGPSWFGPAKLGDLGSVRRSDPAMASPPSSPLSAVAREEEDQPEGGRPGSRGSSINFSYPTRTRRGSSTVLPATETSSTPHIPSQADPAPAAPRDTQASKTRTATYPPPRRQPSVSSSIRGQPISTSADQELVYDANSRRMVRQADLLAVEHAQQVLSGISSQPTGSRKKRTPQRAGSHLAVGAMNHSRAEISRTPSAAKPHPPTIASQDQPQPSVRPLQSKEPDRSQRSQKDTEEYSGSLVVEGPPRSIAEKPGQTVAEKAVNHARTSSRSLASPAPVAPDAAAQFVRRQPSVIEEKPEPEEARSEERGKTVNLEAPDTAPVRQKAQASVSQEAPTPMTPPQSVGAAKRRPFEHDSVTQTRQNSTPDLAHSTNDRKPLADTTEQRKDAHTLHQRAHSISPIRQAHFGPVQDNLTVRHSPPPRSSSPRKSAMKRTHPSEGTSLSDDNSELSGGAGQEPPVSRSPGSVNQKGSSLTSSPPYSDRQGWLGNNARNHVSSSFDDDFVMKPRPALPSFGSVRGRKPRDTGTEEPERPLVRPRGGGGGGGGGGEKKYSEPTPLLPSPPLGTSSDHALGAVLSKEAARDEKTSGITQDTPHHREPLPPVVTSVEGSGYFSDTSDTSSLLSSEFDPHPTSPPRRTAEPRFESPAGPPAEVHKALPAESSAMDAESEVASPPVSSIQQQDASAKEKPQVPEISILQPTPPGTANQSSEQYFADVPGGFPNDDSDQSVPSANATVVGPVESIRKDERHLERTPQSPSAESSSDSDSEIFSDAYEDLSEIEGEGFQSLDAVVESPLQQSARPVPQPEEVLEAQTQISTETSDQTALKETLEPQTRAPLATSAIQSPSAPDTQSDDWEKAKAFLRSLTAEQRALLEKEVLEEAGGSKGEKEEVQSETKAARKTVGWESSERKALAVRMAQQMMAQQKQERQADTGRTYMIKPGERWTGENDPDIPPIRKSMRDEPLQETRLAPAATGSRLRKSMRTEAPNANSNESRPTEARTKSKRPESYHAAVGAPTPKTGGHRRSATQLDVIQPSLRRRGSTGSESSFKRSRSSLKQGLGFRQSLRPTSPPSTMSEDRATKRFSLRAPSPGSSTSSPTSRMRTTLRGSSAAERTSSSGFRLSSFSLPYGGGAKKSGRKRPEERTWSSRLVDSSDEEGEGDAGLGSRFRSRFEDSSDDDDDDDEPVVPIPASHADPVIDNHHQQLRKESSVASTALPEELEDSSEGSQGASEGGKAVIAMQEQQRYDDNAAGVRPTSSANGTPKRNTLRRARSGKGQLLAPATPLPSSSRANNVDSNKNEASATTRTSRRNSILSVLRPLRRRRDVTTTTTSTKISRPEITESAARRDTRLERTVDQLASIRRSRRGGDDGDDDDNDDDDDDNDDDNDEDGRGVAAPPSRASSRRRSPRLQKRWSASAAAAAAAAAAAPPPSPSPPPSPPPPVSLCNGNGNAGAGAGVATIDMLINAAEGDDPGRQHHPHPHHHQQQQPRRRTTTGSSLSGSLGTRTLSTGGGGSSGAGGFFHFHPRRRGASLSMDVSNKDGRDISDETRGGGGGEREGREGEEEGGVDGSVLEGSVAGASSTTRRKRFSALRKMLRINDD
ncbi:hypothetical protein VTH82DRAFT_7531 [Thermothelomyces myriococcoides]